MTSRPAWVNLLKNHKSLYFSLNNDLPNWKQCLSKIRAIMNRCVGQFVTQGTGPTPLSTISSHFLLYHDAETRTNRQKKQWKHYFPSCNFKFNLNDLINIININENESLISDTICFWTVKVDKGLICICHMFVLCLKRKNTLSKNRFFIWSDGSKQSSI